MVEITTNDLKLWGSAVESAIDRICSLEDKIVLDLITKSADKRLRKKNYRYWKTLAGNTAEDRMNQYVLERNKH